MPALDRANIDYNPGIVTTITLNRTKRRNAITTPMLSAMLWAIEQASDDETVRVIILKGAGTGFCPGDELRGMGELPEDFPYRPARYELSHLGLQLALRESPKPTIAAIHGYAFGVGLDLTMACDLRIATTDADLWDPRVSERGMPAVTGVGYFAPRFMGITRALEFLLLARRYTGEEAAAAGIVTRAVAPEDFDQALAEITGYLAKAPTKAIGFMKEQIYKGLEMGHREALEYYRARVREITIEDRKEGVQAFLERREAKFTGR